MIREAIATATIFSTEAGSYWVNDDDRYYVLESLYGNGNPWQDGALALEDIAVHHCTNFYQPFNKGQ